MILTIFFYLITFANITKQDYIRSDELILNENLEIGSEIINLNKLLNQEKLSSESNLHFKIVNDTPLVNYIHLEYLNAETSLIILKKRLVFEDICDVSMQHIEARTISSSILTCAQSIKIVAVNENDFIEIPIELRKINFIKKRPIGLQFKSSSAYLNLTSVDNWFLIEPPVIIADPADQLVLREKIIFTLKSDSDILNVKIQNVTDMLNLSVVFSDEKSLVKSFDFNVEFKVYLNAYFDSNLTDLYELKSNSSQILSLKVTELKKLNLKPLEFEQSIYSMVIENNYLNIDDLILQPKLKSNESDIIFTLFQNDASTSEFPFYVDEKSGAVRVKSQLWNEEDEDYLNKNMNKNFLFGIKATYKRLIESKKTSKTNYYYDYMIPAFTKVQINVRREKVDSAQIHQQIISPFISKYEILNKESSNQTFIYYINEPIKSDSMLCHFSVEFLKSINLNYTMLDWLFTDSTNFEHFKNSTYISIVNKFEFRDGQVYKTNLKFVEKIRNLKRFRILNELNIEFHIDFDPLLFDKSEYKINLLSSNLIDEKILKIKIKDRLKKKLNKTNVENVIYRLMDSDDSAYFEIDSKSGWLSTKKLLAKSDYNLEFLAIDSDIQKTATVKCKVKLDCSTSEILNTKTLFNLFENSPNGSQIGTFKSVCSNINYSYWLDNELSVRLCSKIDAKNCKKFDLSNSTAVSSDLFSISNGFIITNQVLSPSYFVSLIREDYSTIFDDLNDIFESSYVSVLLRVNLKTDNSKVLVYPIEINIQKSPKITNFVGKLNLLSISSISGDLKMFNSTFSCLYNYDFASSSAISRFVRLNENMAHFEAEYGFYECSAKFYINNNGCLSIRMNKDESCRSQSQSDIILKSGTYDLTFKLCFYDQSKVSCSEFYNQTIQVPFDVHNNSQIVLNQDYEFTSRLESSKSAIDFLKKSNISFYFVMLIGVIVLVALITLLFLIIIFSKPKSGVKSSSEKALVLKKDLNFNKLEIITDIRSQTSASTPESTTCTNSTKVSKTDDENDIKIQVLDDYVANKFKQFGYENNNFSYSGSFRSSASCSEEETRNIRVDNDQGLYSVKNASIRFQNESEFVTQKPKDYEFYTRVQELKPESLTKSDLTTYNCLLVNTTLSNNNSSAQLNPCDSYHHKNSTLQKIKNELNTKKAIYTSVVEGKMYNNLNSTGSSTSNSLDNSNNKIVYDTGSYSFLNGNNDMLFSPNDVFASIV